MIDSSLVGSTSSSITPPPPGRHGRCPVAASDRPCLLPRGGGGGRLRTGRGKHHAREQGRSALDQGVRSLDQGRDRPLRLSVREALTGPGVDFMSISPTGANKPIEDIEATLLAATKLALDELVWWAHATMAARAAEAL